MDVQVIDRPRPHTVTSVPQVLTQHYAGLGKRLSWQLYSPENISRLFGQGVAPVRLKDVEESNPELAAELKSGACYINDNGYIQSHDCILCTQSEEVWEDNEARFNEIRQRRESGSAHLEALQAEIEQLNRRAAKLVRGNVPDAREHVGVAQLRMKEKK